MVLYRPLAHPAGLREPGEWCCTVHWPTQLACESRVSGEGRPAPDRKGALLPHNGQVVTRSYHKLPEIWSSLPQMCEPFNEHPGLRQIGMHDELTVGCEASSLRH